MEILLNKTELKELSKIIETKELNMSIADMLLTLFYYPTAINRNNVLSRMKNECLSEESSIIYEALNFLEINLDDEENIEIANSYFKNISCLDFNEYANNPYAKTVKPTPCKKGKYEIKYLEYSPYQLLPKDEINVEMPYFQEISSIGYFKKPFKYLAILENDTVWMSLNPNEINTMKEDINKAHGNVLTFGLGLGYFPFMCSLKDNVNKITIVENNQNIISIFKTYLLPYFPHKDKIEIVYKDAYDFMENDYSDKYDFVFVDIWHTPIDGLVPYIKFKQFENKYNAKFSYWLEPSLEQNLRRCFITIFQEYFEGYDDSNYINFETSYDQIINLIYQQIKDKNYNNLNDILEQLKKDKMLSTSSSFKL